MNTRYECINGCDLRGEPIDPKHFDPALHTVDPKHHAESMERYGRCFCLPYGDKPESERYFSRLIGNVDPDRDRIVEWLCPDCGVRWPR